MQSEQRRWSKDKGWTVTSENGLKERPQLVFVFGAVDVIADPERFEEIKAFYPDARILSGSTAGEILGTTFSEGEIVLTAIRFENTPLQFANLKIAGMEESESAGLKLARMLPADGLVHAMVFCDGLHVNGTSLVKGLLAGLPKTVSVTGGLVGGGDDFKHTYVGLDAVASEDNIVLIGFYGTAVRIGYGSLGGWDPFGPERLITKSDKNVLYELDHKPALTLYKEYLGDKAKDLPGSGLLFPLNLRLPNEHGDQDVVRTLLAVDEKTQSMTFAGDMPEGIYAKLMKANFDRLIDGAAGAAGMSTESLGSKQAQLAILVSCIGRKLVLKDRVEEELEAVQNSVGKDAAMVGFYSYGEICPTAATERQCQLHNQTMTVTTFREE